MQAQRDIKTEPMNYTVLIPLLFIVGLIVYKWNAAGVAIEKVRASGILSTRTDVVAFGGQATITAAERTFNYFVVIWPALVFGILISAVARAYVPRDWFARLTGKKLSAQLVSGAAGAPLMLCSCCVVSIFSTVYERSSRLGPSLAIMLGSPALNPAALILTFSLFAPTIAVARLVMSVATVFLGSVAIERLFGPNPGLTAREFEDRPSAFGRSLKEVLVRTIPVLLVGVICSMLLLEYVPADLMASKGFRSLAVIATASVAVPIALPTFFEIPPALGLLAAGAPIGAAAALVFAGPVINLPSLFAVARSTNWKIAAALAGLIWAVAVFGGLILNQIGS